MYKRHIFAIRCFPSSQVPGFSKVDYVYATTIKYSDGSWDYKTQDGYLRTEKEVMDVKKVTQDEFGNVLAGWVD